MPRHRQQGQEKTAPVPHGKWAAKNSFKSKKSDKNGQLDVEE